MLQTTEADKSEPKKNDLILPIAVGAGAVVIIAVVVVVVLKKPAKKDEE